MLFGSVFTFKGENNILKTQILDLLRIYGPKKTLGGINIDFSVFIFKIFRSMIFVSNLFLKYTIFV